MFGYITPSYDELTPDQKRRYASLYCGICRTMGKQNGLFSRLALSYDLTFLALLLSSLYEPEEVLGEGRCLPHPVRKRPYVTNDIISYCADMNIALAYFSAKDKWADDRRPDAKALQQALAPHYRRIQAQWPRQCSVIEAELNTLSSLEKEQCSNPDAPANCFGRLLAAVFTYRMDNWSEHLQKAAFSLGRYIYLADAATDRRKDARRGSYNPLLTMASSPDRDAMEELLSREMGECTYHYEMLPLVQDKPLMDNILYSGIWVTYRQKTKHSFGGTTP